VASALYTASGELIPDSWLGRETNVDPKSADGKWIQTYLDGRPIVWPAHLAGATFPNTILVAAPVLSVNGQFQRLTIYDAWDRYADIRRTNVALLELFPFLVLLLAAATYFAVGISFKPLNKLLAQAHQLGFDDRLATADKAEFGQLAASINQYLDRIQEVVKQQEEFAVDAAHELCTPLTALRGELELAMMQRRDSAGYEEAAKNAVAQVARLQRLVEGLLLATRPREASVTKCDVEQILEEVQARWVDRYAAHHVNLELSAEAFKASMPEEELESVLENLLSNALKFSPPGSTVRIALDVKGGLVVEDQGPGIPESDRDRIFERFERGTTKARGFGVGLYLVRRLLEQRGGSVKIGDSKIGTRVEVALPA
jgi:signal transduction histidine kinase